MISSGFKAIFFKETKQIMRDPFTLFFVVLIPVAYLFIFGYAINFEVKNMKTVVCNFDQKHQSYELIKQLENSSYFKVVKYTADKNDIYEMIKAGKAQVGILIPEDYSQRVITANSPKLLAIIDGSDSTVGPQASTAMTAIGLQGSLEILSQKVGKSGSFMEISTKMLFNPDSKTANYMIPALIALILQLTTVMLTAMSIVKEKESGTLDQIKIAPISPLDLAIGKIAPYAIIGFIQVFIVNISMVELFHVPFNGNFLLLLFLSFVFIITTLAMGLLISTIAKNFIQALQMSLAFILPAVLLSGFISPRELMPDVLYFISFLIPGTYFIDIMRGVVLRGADFFDMMNNFLALVAMFILYITVAIKKFKEL